MTIEIKNSELERLLEERQKSGNTRSIEEVLLDALRAEESTVPRGEAERAESLVAFLRRSPLVGLELDFDRDQDTGRDISL